MSVNTANQV